jgi:hypothetical protein
VRKKLFFENKKSSRACFSGTGGDDNQFCFFNVALVWRAGSQAHFPRLGGRKKNKNILNVASSISEQQEENSMIFPRLPLP